MPAAECRLSEPKTIGSRLVHVPTGSPALRVSVTMTPDSIAGWRRGAATLRSGYYANPLGAAGWTCRYARAQGVWVATHCRTDWVS